MVQYFSQVNDTHLTSRYLAGSCCTILRYIPTLWSSAPNASLLAGVKIRSPTLIRSPLDLGDGETSRSHVALGLTSSFSYCVCYSICAGLSIPFFEWACHQSFSGMYLADQSIWLMIVASLAVFDVSKAVENGVEVTPEIDPSSHTVRYSAGDTTPVRVWN